MQQRTEFIKLLTASFVSQSGSHLLTIALAGFILFNSGSITQASLVFILSYLPSIFVGGWAGARIDRHLSRRFLVRNEIISIAVSSLCGVCIMFGAPLVFLCVLIALRSLLLFTARSAGIKWIKLITPMASQSLRVKFFYLSFFLATAVAGVIAATALSRPSILVVALIDVGSYLLSAGILLTLRELPSVEQAAPTAVVAFDTLTSLREILSRPALSPHFISVCVSQSVFQGAYSVLVSYLPISRFHLSIRGVGPFQLAASFGIIVGFLVLWLAPHTFAKKRHAQPRALLLTIGVGVASLIICVAVPVLASSLFSLFLFNAAYECIWLHSISEFIQHSPQNTMARYQFVLTSSASCAMAVFTLSYAILIELLGLQTSIAAVVSAGLLLWGCVSHRNSKRTHIFTARELNHE